MNIKSASDLLEFQRIRFGIMSRVGLVPPITRNRDWNS